MSGLAGLLARHVEPGVYTWHSHLPVADVSHSVEHAGSTFGAIDGVGVDSKQAFLAAIADALAFPDWFGHNLDALADALRDVTAPEGGEVVLLWDEWANLARSDRSTFEAVLSILRSRAAAEEEVPFSVLLRGVTPEDPEGAHHLLSFDIPSLD